MEYRVTYYRTHRDDLPVFEFINSFDDNVGAKYNRLINMLFHLGPHLTMPYSRKITTHLYELRIKGKNEIRIIYTVFKGTYVLLHAFSKKTKKTPVKEIRISEDRRLTLT